MAANKVIHRDKFMKGAMTPNEAHRKWGLGRRCTNCKGPGAIRIRVLMPTDELVKRAPNFFAAIMASNPDESGKLPVVRFKESAGDQVGKDYIKASDTVWCDQCKTEARLTAARNAPSWAVVEIDEGPKDMIQVGYEA
jgi:hypothetical protein